MKKLLWLFPILLVSFTLAAQATPQEKRAVRDDLAREHDKRVDATKHVLRGEPALAKEDHREAVAYHKAAVRKVNQVHRRNVRRDHHKVVHHRRHHRVHHTRHH